MHPVLVPVGDGVLVGVFELVAVGVREGVGEGVAEGVAESVPVANADSVINGVAVCEPTPSIELTSSSTHIATRAPRTGQRAN